MAKLMAQSGVEDVEINFMDVTTVSENSRQEPEISDDFLTSPQYRDAIYVLKNLQAPPQLTSTKAKLVKLMSSRYCIINGFLYCKDPGGIILNYLLETEVRAKINEFHKKDCGGHLYWKTTTYKLLRAGFYWPTLFSDGYKEISTAMNVRSLKAREN